MSLFDKDWEERHRAKRAQDKQDGVVRIGGSGDEAGNVQALRG